MVIKAPLVSRSSSCLRKYRIFFVFGILLLCTQAYLAYIFFTLEHQGLQKPGEIFGDENNYLQDQEDGGLPTGTRQFKLPPDKQDNSSKISNRNRTTRVKLDYKSLNFIPVCEVIGREAVSAISRAQSQMCKEHIVNVTCLSQQNLLYPKVLESSCSHSYGFNGTPKSLGCFRDDKTSRILPSYYTVLKSSNSPEQCAYLCLQSGYPYAGVQYSIECFCGKEEPSKTHQLPDSSCNMKCPGDPRKNCGGYLTINVFFTGIKRFVPQHAKNSSSKSIDDSPVKIAYLLTVNGRASRQVKRLISILYDPSHLYYIHVDKRQDYMYQEMLEVERKCKRKNIIVAKGSGLRHASIWGGASLLTTFLSSARQMLLHSKNWDFLVNLSESDYPIKTNAQLVEFLTWNRGMNFVKSHGREVQRFLTKQGLDKTFVECEARMWRVGDRKLPNGIQIDGGSDWVALSRDFVEYVAHPEPDSLVSGLLQIFQYTLLPAESFFHTVLRNSRFCDTYIDNNLHVTNWKRKLGCKCQYKAVVDWCGCSPNDFKLEDFGRIKNTAKKNLFFARKFEPVIDQRIIDRVELWLYPERINSSTSQALSQGVDAYWQSLYNYEDASPLADDALLTVSYSLARLVYQRFGEPDGSGIHLLESTAYFYENRFTGILVKAASDRFAMESSTLLSSDFPEQVEALIRYKKHLSISRSWVGKILGLTVNTDYDQKEQMFRNFMGSIGPLSRPVLAYEFDITVELPLNFTILWLDPKEKIAEITNVQVEDSASIGHVSAELGDPLEIGIWRVYVLLNSKLIAKLNFLVVPLTHWQNRPIGYEKARALNHGPSNPYRVTNQASERWLTIIKAHIPTKEPKNVEQEVKIGWRLERWVDALVNEHYQIVDVCNASDEQRHKRKKKNAKLGLQQCATSDWSSLSPDPKSDISSLCQS